MRIGRRGHGRTSTQDYRKAPRPASRARRRRLNLLFAGAKRETESSSAPLPTRSFRGMLQGISAGAGMSKTQQFASEPTKHERSSEAQLSGLPAIRVLRQGTRSIRRDETLRVADPSDTTEQAGISAQPVRQALKPIAQLTKADVGSNVALRSRRVGHSRESGVIQAARGPARHFAKASRPLVTDWTDQHWPTPWG